jgi:protein phosphatase
VAFGRAKNGGRGAKFLTREHRVTSGEERERLQRAHGIKLPHGARRLHGLALTRALGDSFLKREKVGIIATPDVSPPVEVVRGDGWDVAVLASDGLWDVCSAEAALGAAAKSGGSDQGKDASGRRRVGVNPAAAAESLVAHARRRKSKDDTAVLAVRLEC